MTDLALALAVIARPDVRDPAQTLPPFDPRGHLRKLGGLRIAYSETLGYATPSSEVVGAVREAVAALRSAGATIDEVDPGIASPGSIVRRLFAARAAWTVRDLSDEQRALLDPAVEASAREGERLTAVEYLQAEAERVEVMQALARFHAKYDFSVTPTSGEPAPWVDFDPSAPSERPRESYAGLFSLTRQPALSIPCGWTRAGLPIGLQIVGRHHEESAILALAEEYERIRRCVAPPL